MDIARGNFAEITGDTIWVLREAAASLHPLVRYARTLDEFIEKRIEEGDSMQLFSDFKERFLS